MGTTTLSEGMGKESFPWGLAMVLGAGPRGRRGGPPSGGGLLDADPAGEEAPAPAEVHGGQHERQPQPVAPPQPAVPDGQPSDRGRGEVGAGDQPQRTPDEPAH